MFIHMYMYTHICIYICVTCTCIYTCNQILANLVNACAKVCMYIFYLKLCNLPELHVFRTTCFRGNPISLPSSGSLKKSETMKDRKHHRSTVHVHT